MPDIDLNLLTALNALLTECSVTRAAKRVGLSTSAMSRTLTRLRQATGDLLLVQAGRQMVPTPYAITLAERVQETALNAHALLQPANQHLDLANLERRFVIRASDGFIDLTAAALLREMQQTAPKVQLLFVNKADKDAQALRAGNIDLEIGVLGTDAPELKTRLLFSDRFVGICRRDHPLLNAEVTPERYASFPHIVISRKNQLHGPVDAALERLGIQRQIMMSVPSYHSAIKVVASSDAIGLVPLTVMCWSEPAAELVHFELPVSTPPIKVSAIWHPRLQSDHAHRWLRETLVAVCRSQHERYTGTQVL